MHENAPLSTSTGAMRVMSNFPVISGVLAAIIGLDDACQFTGSRMFGLLHCSSFFQEHITLLHDGNLHPAPKSEPKNLKLAFTFRIFIFILLYYLQVINAPVPNHRRKSSKSQVLYFGNFVANLRNRYF